MITKITFQFQVGKSFHNPALKPLGVLGERDTNDLQKLLVDQLAIMDIVLGIVQDLNKDLSGSSVKDVLRFWTGKEIVPTPKTKKKRTYSTGILTIHEEDK